MRALLAYKRGEPRVCGMVRVPSVEEEDHRRIGRERKVLVSERTCHVNRIKGLLFAQGITGYEPLRRDRRHRLEELQTGDGRTLPEHLKEQIRRELDRLELVIAQIKEVQAERDALLAIEVAETPTATLLDLKGIGPECAAILYTEGRSGTSIIAGRSPPMPGSRRHLGRADRSSTSKASRRPATPGCERR